MPQLSPQKQLMPYLEERAEGVLRLLEGGKRRGFEEFEKGKGRGSKKELFQAVAASQRAFVDLHNRCCAALRVARKEEVREIVVDVQYLIDLFSRQVYEIAFVSEIGQDAVSFPPPQAYSRHYPGPGPQDPSSLQLFREYFGETAYSAEKSSPSFSYHLDQIRKDRLEGIFHSRRST